MQTWIKLSLRLRQLTSMNRQGERGAGLVEYALLIALIAMVCVVAVMYFGDETSASFSSSTERINNA